MRAGLLSGWIKKRIVPVRQGLCCKTHLDGLARDKSRAGKCGMAERPVFVPVKGGKALKRSIDVLDDRFELMSGEHFGDSVTSKCPEWINSAQKCKKIASSKAGYFSPIA
jgi:hypothetical protein